MEPTTVQELQKKAQALLNGTIRWPTKVEQRAIAIAEILKDGEWHTAKTIAGQIGLSRQYVYDILRALHQEWGLQTHRSKGWYLPPK